MAKCRCFSRAIIGAGKFLKMPPTARLLYYDLGMQADDDGIVEAYNVMATTRATEDDLRVLIAKGFVKVLNDDLVTYICDWNTNNYIRPDRYKPTIYADLLLQIGEMTTNCLPNDNQMTTNCLPNDNQTQAQDKLSKDKLSKDKTSKDKINKKAATPVVYYPNDEYLDATLKEFIKMRKTIKAPMTEKAIELLMAKLERLATKDGVFDNDLAIELLNTSIEKSWKTIYPKAESKGGKQQKTAQDLADEWNIF